MKKLLVLYPRLKPLAIPPMYVRRLAEDMARIGGHCVYGPKREGYIEGETVPKIIERLGPFDGVLVLETKFCSTWVLDISEVEIRKACLITDYTTYKRQSERANRFLDASNFDLLFYHTAIEAENLIKSQRTEKSVFIPFGVDTSFLKPLGFKQTIDVCAMWCDNATAYPERLAIKDKLKETGLNLFLDQAFEENYVTALNLSKISLNSKTLFENITPRWMEILACGSMLLSDIATESEFLGFIPGKHFVLYDGVDDCIEKARYYSANDDERKQIAIDGHRFVVENFRNEKLIEKIEREMFSW